MSRSRLKPRPVNHEDVHRHRLAVLVAKNLSGAELRNFRLTETNDTEYVFVVLWRRDREWGTHRACLVKDGEEGMLVWGHYFLSGEPVADANRDFLARIAEDA